MNIKEIAIAPQAGGESEHVYITCLRILLLWVYVKSLDDINQRDVARPLSSKKNNCIRVNNVLYKEDFALQFKITSWMQRYFNLLRKLRFKK
jgi:hypothetical protein